MSVLNALSLLGAALLSCTLSAVQATQALFSLNISAKDDTVPAGSTVKVEIVLTNTSNRVIYIIHEKAPDAGEQAGFTLDVRNADGSVVAFTRYGQKFFNHEAVFLGAPAPFALKPGNPLKDEIVVSKLFDLSKPGKYSIQVKRLDDSSSTEVSSNIISVTITPSAAVHEK
jgi:uncharacterized protein (DUF58 family)